MAKTTVKKAKMSKGEALARARAARRKMSAKDEARKLVRTTPLEKLAKRPTSLRLAVNAMCYQCQGENADPSVQWRIGNCEIKTCALHGVRPYRRHEGKEPPAWIRKQAGWTDKDREDDEVVGDDEHEKEEEAEIPKKKSRTATRTASTKQVRRKTPASDARNKTTPKKKVVKKKTRK